MVEVASVQGVCGVGQRIARKVAAVPDRIKAVTNCLPTLDVRWVGPRKSVPLIKTKSPLIGIHLAKTTGMTLGSALAVIGAILGHTDVKTTSRYAHLADDPVRNAANEISKSVHAAFVGKSLGEVIPLRETRRKA